MSYLFCPKCQKYVMTEKQTDVDNFIPIPYEVEDDYLDTCNKDDGEHLCEHCAEELEVVNDYDDGRDYEPDERDRDIDDYKGSNL